MAGVVNLFTLASAAPGTICFWNYIINKHWTRQVHKYIVVLLQHLSWVNHTLPTTLGHRHLRVVTVFGFVSHGSDLCYVIFVLESLLSDEPDVNEKGTNVTFWNLPCRLLWFFLVTGFRWPGGYVFNHWFQGAHFFVLESRVSRDPDNVWNHCFRMAQMYVYVVELLLSDGPDVMFCFATTFVRWLKCWCFWVSHFQMAGT